MVTPFFVCLLNKGWDFCSCWKREILRESSSSILFLVSHVGRLLSDDVSLDKWLECFVTFKYPRSSLLNRHLTSPLFGPLHETLPSLWARGQRLDSPTSALLHNCKRFPLPARSAYRSLALFLVDRVNLLDFSVSCIHRKHSRIRIGKIYASQWQRWIFNLTLPDKNGKSSRN